MAVAILTVRVSIEEGLWCGDLRNECLFEKLFEFTANGIPQSEHGRNKNIGLTGFYFLNGTNV